MPAERSQMRTLLILGALGVTFVLGLWAPLRIRQARAERSLEQLGASIDADRRATVSLMALGQRIVSLDEAAARFNKVVPHQPALAPLLEQLTSNLEEHQVKALDVRPAQIASGADFCAIPIRLSFQGSCQTAFAFLQHVESMDRLIQISQVEMAGDPRRPDDPLEVTIGLTTFCTPGQGGPDK